MHISKQKILCNKCSIYISKPNFNKHENVCSGPKIKKIRGVDFDPNWGFVSGNRKAWNKGLRSKPDTRDPALIGKLGGYRANAGRSHKYKVLDSFGKEVTLQSSYELTCSQILDKMSIKWIRPSHLKYDGRCYFPDFYLVDYDVYLDPKNDYKAIQDADKIQKVIDQNSVKVFVLSKKQLSEEYIASVIQW